MFRYCFDVFIYYLLFYLDKEVNFKKRTHSQVTFEDNASYITVSTKSPLWVCERAMDATNDCVYCLCHKCYCSSEKSHSSRARRGSNKRSDTDNDGCNHTSLSQTDDNQYFTSSYQETIIKKRDMLPTKCSSCSRPFIKRSPIGLV